MVFYFFFINIVVEETTFVKYAISIQSSGSVWKKGTHTEVGAVVNIVHAVLLLLKTVAGKCCDLLHLQDSFYVTLAGMRF